MNEPVDPFDQTKVMLGVPELPAESTLVLPINQPRPEDVKAQVQSAAKPRSAKRGWMIAAAAAVIALACGGWWAFRSGVGPGGTEALANPVPPSLQGYLEAAHHGDAKAMRMLGASYTYGLGVRVNKSEGAAWYRKAAEAGDKTAAQELQAVNPR
ncbi:MAG: sel1 repeat family protein [Acidobacteria bacterium]|nr:sel1 repeat family protein [Acidobacteriota bacterium]